jgi:hypothetical protein
LSFTYTYTIVWRLFFMRVSMCLSMCVCVQKIVPSAVARQLRIMGVMGVKCHIVQSADWHQIRLGDSMKQHAQPRGLYAVLEGRSTERVSINVGVSCVGVYGMTTP